MIVRGRMRGHAFTPTPPDDDSAWFALCDVGPRKTLWAVFDVEGVPWL
jgi:hypothetical protein